MAVHPLSFLTDKCDKDNNGCDQVCDRQTAECVCNQGWTLADDLKNCDGRFSLCIQQRHFDLFRD